MNMLIYNLSKATGIRDIDGDAQVCMARGTVVTSAKAMPNEMTDRAGP